MGLNFAKKEIQAIRKEIKKSFWISWISFIFIFSFIYFLPAEFNEDSAVIHFIFYYILVLKSKTIYIYFFLLSTRASTFIIKELVGISFDYIILLFILLYLALYNCARYSRGFESLVRNLYRNSFGIPNKILVFISSRNECYVCRRFWWRNCKIYQFWRYSKNFWCELIFAWPLNPLTLNLK